MPKFTSLALGSAAALLLAPTATEATPVQLVCGNAQPVNKVYGDPELDGAPQYMATINGVGPAGSSNQFTVTANMTVVPSSISCSPADCMIQFIGNGKGSFGPHEFMYPSKDNSKDNVKFVVNALGRDDPATSYDWIAISQEATGCDYQVLVHTFTIDCPDNAPQYQCVGSKCVPADTGVSQAVCASVCHTAPVDVSIQKQPTVATGAPATSHYGDPLVNDCMSDEQNITITGVAGSVCSPAATGILKQKCPTDVPAGCTIVPKALLQDQSGDKYCALECAPALPIKDQKLADTICGVDNMSCKPISGVGICTYDA